MPNGNKLNDLTINDLDLTYGLTYKNYEGFTGLMKDSILTDFTILIKDNFQKIGRDVVNEEYIKKIKHEKIIGLRYNKIPETKMNYQNVLDYILRRYSNLRRTTTQSKLDIGINKEIVFLNAENETVVRVQYSKFGITGTIVTLECCCPPVPVSVPTVK